MKNNFELIVRGLVIKDGKVLVCQTKGRDYFFLPGGHVKFSETLRDALLREFEEEIGVRPKIKRFIGNVENIFKQNRESKHEINFVFELDFYGDVVVPLEDHITFHWLTPEQLINGRFVPPALLSAIIKWTADKKTFLILSEESSI